MTFYGIAGSSDIALGPTGFFEKFQITMVAEDITYQNISLNFNLTV